MRNQTHRLLTAVVLLFGLQTTSWGIVINDTSGSATAIANGTAFTPIVELSLGGGLCTGSLISSTHIATAQHCTFGTATGVMTVNFHLDNDGIPDIVRAVSAKAEMNATNILTDGTDVAILTMAAAVNTITPLAFAGAGLVNVADLVTSVGFGLNGLGSVGHQGTRDGLRWAVDNILDDIGNARDPGNDAGGGDPFLGITAAEGNILNTDFDDGSAANNRLGSATPVTNEGTTAGGDSGGPLVINNLIAGVLSGGTTGNSVFKDVSWWTGTFSANVRGFILAATNNMATYVDRMEVPEPGTLFLMLIGLAGLMFARRRNFA